ncbi:MAG TPA: hypothetical protein VK211_23080, partial [Kamptonema sp.]|nr:hypothetical protein [Kamptonema sp.]
PDEVCSELRQVLDILRKDGLFSRTDFYDVNTNMIAGGTFNLFYRVDFARKEVLVIEVKVKVADVFKQRFPIIDHWDDKDVVESIPQYDQPKKNLKAIMLIHQGVTDSYDLGWELGHKAKNNKDIARQGQYAKHSLEQLKLISRIRKGKKYITELTEKGKLIANAPNDDLRYRLLAQSMLNYLPIWRIIVAVTKIEDTLDSNSNWVLDKETIKNITFPKVLHSSDISNRRSETLLSWIRWISNYCGIPIRFHEEGVQLSIPMLYSDQQLDGETDTK